MAKHYCTFKGRTKLTQFVNSLTSIPYFGVWRNVVFFRKKIFCLCQFRGKLFLFYFSSSMFFWLFARTFTMKVLSYPIFSVLKGPKHENFGSEFLKPSRPIWVGNIGTGWKTLFFNRCAFDVFSAKIVFSACSLLSSRFMLLSALFSTCWIFEAPAEQWACALKSK